MLPVVPIPGELTTADTPDGTFSRVAVSAPVDVVRVTLTATCVLASPGKTSAVEFARENEKPGVPVPPEPPEPPVPPEPPLPLELPPPHPLIRHAAHAQAAARPINFARTLIRVSLTRGVRSAPASLSSNTRSA